MANSFLTPSVITKEALAILHQKLNFVSNINTQYDDQYAKTGAKIGNDLKVRYQTSSLSVVAQLSALRTSMSLLKL